MPKDSSNASSRAQNVREEAFALLEVLRERHKGTAVEVRVPYVGAVQILEGTKHRRGTPPAVIEMDAETWVQIATGAVSWKQAEASGDIYASGMRADLSSILPLQS